MSTATANRIAEIRAIAASGITETVRVTREQDYYGFARFAGMEVFDLSSVQRAHVAAELEWQAAQKAGRHDDADAFRALYEELDAALNPEDWADDDDEEAEPTTGRPGRCPKCAMVFTDPRCPRCNSELEYC